MTLVVTFILVTGCAVAGSLVTALALRTQLRHLLDEVCGSPARSRFWVTFSLLIVILTGVLAGTSTLGYPDGPDPSSHDVLMGAVTQIRYWLVGVLGSLLLVALGLFRGVQRFEARAEREAYFRATSAMGAPPAPQP